MRSEISTVDHASQRLEGENQKLQGEIRVTLQKLGERMARLKDLEASRDSSYTLMQNGRDSAALLKEHTRAIEEAI